MTVPTHASSPPEVYDYYLTNVVHYVDYRPEGEGVDPDERFMRDFEETGPNPIPEQGADDFRRVVMCHLGQLAAKGKDVKIPNRQMSLMIHGWLCRQNFINRAAELLTAEAAWWSNSNVRNLARQAVSGFAGLDGRGPILADMIEDAGGPAWAANHFRYEEDHVPWAAGDDRHPCWLLNLCAVPHPNHRLFIVQLAAAMDPYDVGLEYVTMPNPPEKPNE